MKLNFKLFFLILFIITNTYAQKDENQNKYDLSSSLKSFEVLANLLSKKDTASLKLVVTDKAFKSFNFKALDDLQKLGLEWENKKTAIIEQTKNKEIIKVEGYYVPVIFIKENNGEWKFSTFKINN